MRNDPEFKIPDLLYHTHRIYVYGSNSYLNNWFLEDNIPEGLDYLIFKDEYKKFVNVNIYI